jgi:hypothetical protein
MTRAVYLELLPLFMYQTEKELLNECNKKDNIDLPALYHKKMDKLQKKYCQDNSKKIGIIGNSKNGEVQRQPWDIYWNFLVIWDLIPAVYHNGEKVTSLESYVRLLCDKIRTLSFELDKRWNGYWDVSRKTYNKNPGINLTEAGRTFVLSKMQRQDSLLSKLLDSGKVTKVSFADLQPPENFDEEPVWKQARFFYYFTRTAFAGYNLLLNATEENKNYFFDETIKDFKKYADEKFLEEVLGLVSNTKYEPRKNLLRKWFYACCKEKFEMSELKYLVEEEFICKSESKANCRLFRGKKFSSLEDIRKIIPPDKERKWVGMRELDFRCYESTRLLHHLLSKKYLDDEKEGANQHDN